MMPNIPIDNGSLSKALLVKPTVRFINNTIVIDTSVLLFVYLLLMFTLYYYSIHSPPLFYAPLVAIQNLPSHPYIQHHRIFLNGPNSTKLLLPFNSFERYVAICSINFVFFITEVEICC